MRGLPQWPGAYLGLRMNSGIVRRPVVSYDKAANPGDERDLLPAVCLCGASTTTCANPAPSCGATENGENADGDNIVVLNQQAGFQPGDRIRILRYPEATAGTASTVNKDFTAQVTAVTIVPDSAAPATYREWLELGDIRFLSQQCDMTSVTDNNSVPGIVDCAGGTVDVNSEQIVYVNPNTGNDDKFCFINGGGGGGTYPKTANSCQFDYSWGVAGASGAPNYTGTGNQDSDWTYTNCSSGNFDRGPDGVWHHVVLYTSIAADGENSDRYRTCMRNNYWPSATAGDLTTNLNALGWWQTNSNANNSGRNTDETGLSTQIGAMRLDYGDQGSGITGAGNKQHYNFTIALVNLTLDADYNLVPGFFNQDIMVPSRPAGEKPLVGRMGLDFAGMMLTNLNVDGWIPGNGTNNHTVATYLRTGVTDYSATIWVNPYNSQICQSLVGGGVSGVCEPQPVGIMRDNVTMGSGGPDANIRKDDIVPWFTDPARVDIFARRVVGIPRRPLWAGGFNNVHSRIVRQGDGTSPSYLKISYSGATAAQNVWSRTGMFLAMSEKSGESGGTNWREFYTSYLAANSVDEKMTIAAKSLGNTVPLSLPIYFTDVMYNGDTVLPSHMVSNYSYYNSSGTAGGSCPLSTPPGNGIPNSNAPCLSPNNPVNASGLYPYLIDRIEVSGARVKALTTNARILYPAMPAGDQRLCTSWDRQTSAGPYGIQGYGACGGGLSRPGGFATVRANDTGAAGDGSATADLYWPSFGQSTVQVQISAPGVPAATYQRSVVCPAGGCPP